MTVQVMYGDSTYKYGNTNRLYGVPGTTTDNFLWSIEIDWDNDGHFNGDNEAKYCTDMETDRGFSELYDTDENGNKIPGLPMVGTGKITLLNDTERFSAWSTNPNSLGFQVCPGKKINIRVRKGYTGTESHVFTGIVKNIVEDKINKKVFIYFNDNIEYLAETDISIGNQQNIYQDDLILTILSATGWRWGTSNIQSLSGDVLPLFKSNQKAIHALRDLMASYSYFIFYTAGNGDFTKGPLTTGTGTYFTDSGVFLKDIDVSQPWENILTSGTSYLYSYTKQANSVLWSQGEVQTFVPALSSIEIFTELTYNNGVLFSADVSELVSGVDYIANTIADGSGTNITSSFTVAITQLGERAQLIITNANGSDGYLTTLQIKGDAYLENVSYKKQNFTDYLGVGKKNIVLKSPFMQNMPNGQPSATYYQYNGYPHSTKNVTIRLRTRAEQFQQDINSTVYFSFDPIKATLWRITPDDYYNFFLISRIRHKWQSETGQDILTTWDLRHVLMTTVPTEI